MNQGQDLTSAVRQRERSRNRIRLLTVTAGAASLATAGVVAYYLPAPAHTTAVSGTTTPAAQPSASQQSGDDSQGDDSQGSGGTVVTAPSGTSGQATSGGS